MRYEKLITALMNFYNSTRKYFKDVPPLKDYNISLPEATTKGEKKVEKAVVEVIIDVNPQKNNVKNIFSPMQTETKILKRRLKCTIIANPHYYRQSVDLKDLLLFPPLHEMVHIKEAVLYINNLSFNYENHSDFDFSRVKKLFDDLRYGKNNFLFKLNCLLRDSINFYIFLM